MTVRTCFHAHTVPLFVVLLFFRNLAAPAATFDFNFQLLPPQPTTILASSTTNSTLLNYCGRRPKLVHRLCARAKRFAEQPAKGRNDFYEIMFIFTLGNYW